ncbi:MAG: anti-sigma factor antagonist [Actinophytocola sp.]|uniref:STAS domain-containing protein n=1 Tax=Actinophytocola sp. TaxID=1872138 RepID=UPI0013267D38|nr:STAS domain-containing protein [Actinophytocola sp.]MPZ81862.1 anti-sigma factor antagonist [Actinophytocola sp.]
MNEDPSENGKGDALPDEAPLVIRVERDRSAAIVHVAGEIDLSTAPMLRESITTVLKESPPLLIVDLTEVGFLASAGLNELIVAGEQAEPLTRLRVVTAGRSTTLRTLNLTGLDNVLAIFPTVDEALATPAVDE